MGAAHGLDQLGGDAVAEHTAFFMQRTRDRPTAST
jgi:hypothetical protein